MAPVDAWFIVSSVAFGVLLGSILGHNRDDRVLSVSVFGAAWVAGVISWIVSSPETMPETAGVSLTIGCPVAIAVVLFMSRRRGDRTAPPPPAPH